MSEARVIAVFGGSGAVPGSEAYAVGEAVGREIAALGCAVATGGYGGTMEAVSRGAAAGGAEVIGVTCRLWRSSPNTYVTRLIETEDYYHRLRMLVEVGTAGYVVLPGATGTLVELALVWELAAKGAFHPPRPIVCVGDYWRPLDGVLAGRRASAGALLTFVSRPGEIPRHFRGA